MNKTEPRPTGPGPKPTSTRLRGAGVIGALVAVAMLLSACDSGGGDTAAQKGPAAQGVAAVSKVAEKVVPDLTPKADLSPAPEDEAHVSVAPDVPPPLKRTKQAIVDVEFELVEGISTVNPTTGVKTETWGYRIADGPDGIVVGTPGPMIRARVGDLLRFTLTNPAENQSPHNIDLHAVTGPGGGASAASVKPGESKTIEARILYPGFFLYHCAFGDIPAHMGHGMFGGILIDPETPLPSVDHEWYVAQSEWYLDSTDAGVVGFDRAKATTEEPSFVVFNGAVGALAGDNALKMAVGERSRLYFANAGLNLDSNLHPIGSQWDKVYPEATVLSPPLRGSQTTLVPSGGATIVELVAYSPSTLLLVDHAITRAIDKGAVGQIVITGDEDPEIFEGAAVEGGHGDAAAAGDAKAGGAGESVSILKGAFTAQGLDAPDEFAEHESPADYSVNVLKVKAGGTVTWTNADPGQIHTVTADGGAFDAGFLETGKSFSFTFDEPGEYTYHCRPHPYMKAKVVVG